MDSEAVSVEVVAEETTTVDFDLDAVITTGTIAGTVSDADTGDGIEDATVFLDGNAAATTDADGNYEITDVEAGTYELSASADGYADSEAVSVEVVADATSIVDLALEAEVDFPVDVTLTVIGGNVVLNENDGVEDDTGACVDFGLEGLCDEATEPDPGEEGITLEGTLEEDGSLTIPSEGVSFPETDPELTDVGVWLQSTIEFPDGLTGSLDTDTGETQIEGLLTFALTFFANDDGEPGEEVAKCTVGADMDATHDDPGKEIVDTTVEAYPGSWPAGEAYDSSTGIGRVAHTDMVVDGPLVQSGDGTEPGTCDSGFFGGIVLGEVNGTLGISDGPNSDNYIGVQFQMDPVL